MEKICRNTRIWNLFLSTGTSSPEEQVSWSVFVFFKRLSAANRGRARSGSQSGPLQLRPDFILPVSFVHLASCISGCLLTQLPAILIERKINEPLHSWFRGEDFIGVLAPRETSISLPVVAFTCTSQRMQLNQRSTPCTVKGRVTNWYSVFERSSVIATVVSYSPRVVSKRIENVEAKSTLTLSDWFNRCFYLNTVTSILLWIFCINAPTSTV